MAKGFTLANARYAIKLAADLDELSEKISALESAHTVHVLIYDQGGRTTFVHREEPNDDRLSSIVTAAVLHELREQRLAIWQQMEAIGLEGRGAS